MLNFLVIFSLLCGSYVFCSAPNTPGKICPPPEMIRPCTCSHPVIIPDVSLDCDKIDNEYTLETVLKRAEDYQFGGLFLYSSTMMSIPSSILNIKLLKTIRIIDSALESLFNQQPSENNNLEEIYLLRSKINRGMVWDQFITLTKLKSITVHKIPIHKFGISFSQNIPSSLDTLKVLDCGIHLIEDNAFSGLTNLGKIYVQKNRVRELRRSMFPVESKIWYFDFSGNHLTTLPDDIFQNMPNLFRVLLSRNSLTILEENIFRPIAHSLQVLDVSGNLINCGCNLKWIVNPDNRPERLVGTCNEPINLRGKSLVDLVAQEFAHC